MTTTASAIDLPFNDAISFFRQKANVTSRHWHDVYASAHSRAFMVAGAASDALVADFRVAIDKAIAEGTTLADFRRDFDDIVGQHGWDYRGGRNWRSRVIFETNLKTAYAAGRYAQLTAPETLQAFPYWQYNHSGARHPRLDHLSWDGMTLRADDPFWRTNYPPNGWGCGCFVIPLSDRDLRRQGGGLHDSPDLVFRAEEVGGRTVRVPQGVDPGFEYNPGMEWLSRTAPGSQTVAASPGLIRRFVDGTVNGQLEPRSFQPVARIAPDLARALNLRPAELELRLTSQTIRTHLHHPAATEAYERLPEFAAGEGTWVLDAQGRITVLFDDPDDGRPWMMGVARAGEGALRVTTLHPSEPRKHRSILRRGTVLRGGK